MSDHPSNEEEQLFQDSSLQLDPEHLSEDIRNIMDLIAQNSLNYQQVTDVILSLIEQLTPAEQNRVSFAQGKNQEPVSFGILKDAYKQVDEKIKEQLINVQEQIKQIVAAQLDHELDKK